MLKDFLKFLHPRFQNLFLEYKVRFEPRYGHGKPAHPELLSIIEGNRDEYSRLLQAALGYKNTFVAIRVANEENDSKKPTWNNGFLPGLDIVGIYTMIAEFRPGRYVEIGSGNSTKVAHLAKHDRQIDMEIVSIDPMPRAEIDALADRIIRQPFEDCDTSICSDLEPGDILFVDNSHRILPNSDSMVFYMEVLPRLKPGVVVHIHDIYLPYDYPQFMCDRFYSEQYGLAMYLLANPDRFEVLLPNYFISQDPGLSEIVAPVWEAENLQGVEKHGGSFWFRIR